jgi:hypothetical protein
MIETETSLAAWLRQHDESPYAFSRRVGVYVQTAYALCGIPSPKAPSFVRTATLERISAETGISVRQLYGDWVEAQWQRRGAAE